MPDLAAVAPLLAPKLSSPFAALFDSHSRRFSPEPLPVVVDGDHNLTREAKIGNTARGINAIHRIAVLPRKRPC
jgi:hypothetical protein